MPAILLSGLLRNWQFVLFSAALAGCLAMGAYGKYLKLRLESAELRAAQATQQLTDAVGAVERAKLEKERTEKTLSRQLAVTEERNRKLKNAVRSVQSAPSTQACVDSPAVRAALSGLQQLSAPEPDNSAADGTKVTPGVPKRAPNR